MNNKKSENSEFITVYVPNSESEHLIIKSLLNNYGIHCFSKNENVQNLFGIGQVGTGYNYITGPIKIQVSSKYFEKANNILDQHFNKGLDNIVPKICPACNKETNDQSECQNCGLRFVEIPDNLTQPESPTKSGNENQKQVNKYIVQSLAFNFLWIFGVGNIIGLHIAKKAFNLIYNSHHKLKGRSYSIGLIIYSMVMFFMTIYFWGSWIR